jgi:hypothetical protein
MLKRYCAFCLGVIAVCFVTACGSVVKPATTVTQAPFPRVAGESLTGERITIPDAYRGKNTLLLIGYTQKAQFDIDRWILGALQADVTVEIVEVPTIAGMMPQMVQGFINNGMRSGIPQSDWASVVTVYEDAPKIIISRRIVVNPARPSSSRLSDAKKITIFRSPHLHFTPPSVTILP